jgi:hypothetical protein
VLKGFARLELSTETLRELNEDELTQVGGGNNPTGTTSLCATGTFLCPSGNTWTANCQITIQTGA